MDKTANFSDVYTRKITSVCLVDGVWNCRWKAGLSLQNCVDTRIL